MRKLISLISIFLVVTCLLVAWSFHVYRTVPDYDPDVADRLIKAAPKYDASTLAGDTPPQENVAIKPSSPTSDTSVKKVGLYTFQGSLPCDSSMGTASDVYTSLNHYRSVHGIGSLAWNANLASVAAMRAAQISANGGRSDSHAGFITFTNDQKNFDKVGFSSLSENVAGTNGCPLLGVHIIEWLFGRDAPHNNAQLDPSWVAVGININGSNVSVIFGKDPK